MSNGLQAYRQLSAGDQAILQVMAVVQNDVNLSELTFLLKDLKAVEPSLWSAMPTQATTRESLAAPACRETTGCPAHTDNDACLSRGGANRLLHSTSSTVRTTADSVRANAQT